MRRHDFGYVQVTKEKLSHARRLAVEVHGELVRRGYEGSPPQFGHRWRSLFTRLHDLVAADQAAGRPGGGLGTVS